MSAPFISGPTIPAGQSLSDVLDCSAAPPVRIRMPADWTSANLSFQVSHDGVNFTDLFDNAGKEVMVSVAPGTSARLSGNWVSAPVFLRFRSGPRDSPVKQQQARVFGVALQGAAAGTVGGEQAVSYVERTTDITLVATDAPIIVTGTLVLEAVPHTIRFFSPGLDMTSNCEAILNIEDNSVSIGQVTTIHANPVSMPFSLLRRFTPIPGNHVLRVVARRVGSGTAIIRSGTGAAGGIWLPSFLEVLKQ